MSMFADSSRLHAPQFPCRVMPTRACPVVFAGVCGDDRPCARFESEDETPWLPELESPVTGDDHS